MSLESPFYFAWVEPNTAFDEVLHAREDEKIIQFTIEHMEGEFATMSIDIRNTGAIGLLATGRKVWAWLAWDNGSEIIPLIHGRLIGLPSNIHREIVTLQFVARPIDYGMQKIALAASLRELPYYDPVFVSPDKRDDPDVVLEGYTLAWNIDRTSHIVSTSDLIVGEDGLVEFEENEIPNDSLDLTLDQPPVRTVHVEAEVPWTQSVIGNVPGFTDKQVVTKAGEGLINGWPKADADLGGGWKVRTSAARSPFQNLTDEDLRNAYPLHAVTLSPILTSALSQSASGTDVSLSSTTFGILNDVVYLSLDFHYEGQRQRKDRIVFDLIADSQPLITLPEDDDQFDLKISGVDVSLPLDPLDEYSEIPIGNVERRSYFATGRGHQSIQYVLQLARAHIIVRSRAVKIKFKCKLARGVEFSLRKNALVRDHRLPGGQAVGKIVEYTLFSSGGEIAATCTMLSVVGYGGAVTAQPGEPVYVEDDYVNYGYQERLEETLILAADDVSFEVLRENPDDDGLIFPLSSPPYIDFPLAVTVEEKGLEPVPAQIQPSVSLDDCGNTTSISYSMTLDTGPYNEWLSGIKTTIDFTMKPVTGGPFETTYQVNVSRLKLPKQIDLEAA